MDIEAYQTYWNRAKPAIEERLNAFLKLIDGQTDLTAGALYQGGDPEFKVCLDMRNARGTLVISLDATLLDAEECGSEEPGVGISVSVEGPDCLPLGNYSPFAYSGDAFTTDVDEILLRIENIDVEHLVNLVIESLTSPALLEALERMEKD
jgi:hypothetical protein